MIFFFKPSALRSSQIESRLLRLAAIFLFLYSVALTLSATVRLRAWNVPYRWQHWLGWLVWYGVMLLFFNYLNRKLPEHDPYLLPITAILSGWGLLTIWRLNENYGFKQTIWLAISVLVCGVIAHRQDVLALLKRYKYVWLVSGLGLTALTFIFGTYPGGEGPHLWLGWGGMYLQPSEPLKLLLIIYLAAYLADQLSTSFNLLRSIIPTFLLVGAALGLLVAQRDLGTASLFIFIYFVILYISTGKRRVLALSVIITGLSAFFGYRLYSVIHLRIDSWINPWLDPTGKSYQIVQSLLAVAAGGMVGRGVGLGSPGIVPVAQSDYIFAAIAEETGLLGIVALLVLFSLLTGRGILISLRSSTAYQRYLSIGITAYFIIQTLFIIGGNLRVLPITGVTLPLVSYGGSSLLTSFVAILLLIFISSEIEEEPSPLPSATPFLLVGSGMLVGLLVIGLVSGYWSIVRAESLLTRTDNPRRSIDDLYVPRGALLDRNDYKIAYTTGKPGDYARQMAVPALAPVVGYTNPTYGQAGLEASLDGYLRGLQGSSGIDIWYNHIVYGQPPPGSDIRLSIDLKVQAKADTLLGNHKGAIVLINAQTGEILAMASHPYLDPNTMEPNGTNWQNDPHSPLVNRATQINYPIGTAIGPALLANAISTHHLPDLPQQLELETNLYGESRLWSCALKTSETTWGEAISKGCPAAVESLFKDSTVKSLQTLISNTKLDQAPQLPLIVAPSDNNIETLPGLSDSRSPVISASPLQMALLASTLSSSGNLPSPTITLSVNIHDHNRVVFTPRQSQTAFSADAAQKTAERLAVNGLPLWQSTANAYLNKDVVTWYLGGTLPSWNGAPLAVTVLLEENNPAEAQDIGMTLLKSIIQPVEK